MKKAFDAVAWMRQRRTQIDEEDKALTWAQKREKTREQVLEDPVLARLCPEVVVPEKAGPKTVKKRSSSGSHNRAGARRS